jgi:hypothetical protein
MGSTVEAIEEEESLVGTMGLENADGMIAPTVGAPRHAAHARAHHSVDTLNLVGQAIEIANGLCGPPKETVGTEGALIDPGGPIRPGGYRGRAPPTGLALLVFAHLDHVLEVADPGQTRIVGLAAGMAGTTDPVLTDRACFLVPEQMNVCPVVDRRGLAKLGFAGGEIEVALGDEAVRNTGLDGGPH